MPLFQCDRCLAVDNTACGGNYWSRLMDADAPTGPVLCCECHTGKWHDRFPKRQFEYKDRGRLHDFLYVVDPVLRARIPGARRPTYVGPPRQLQAQADNLKRQLASVAPGRRPYFQTRIDKLQAKIEAAFQRLREDEEQSDG